MQGGAGSGAVVHVQIWCTDLKLLYNYLHNNRFYTGQQYVVLACKPVRSSEALPGTITDAGMNAATIGQVEDM